MNKYTFEVNLAGQVQRVYISASNEDKARDTIYEKYNEVAWCMLLDVLSYDDKDDSLEGEDVA